MPLMLLKPSCWSVLKEGDQHKLCSLDEDPAKCNRSPLFTFHAEATDLRVAFKIITGIMDEDLNIFYCPYSSPPEQRIGLFSEGCQILEYTSCFSLYGPLR